MVTDAIRSLSHAHDETLAALASRILDRRLYKAIDLGSFGYDEGVQRKEARRIDREFMAKIEMVTIIMGSAAASN